MSITSIGKFLRKLRIEHGEIMKDMADKFGMTSAYLSAIELGKRTLPKGFGNIVENAYQLAEFEVKELNKAISLSTDEVSISLEGKTDVERELMVGFARILGDLNEQDLEKLKQQVSNYNEKKTTGKPSKVSLN